MPRKTTKKTAKKSAKKATKKLASKVPAKKAVKKTAKKVARKTAKKAPVKKATGKQASSSDTGYQEISYAAYLNYVRRVETGVYGDEVGDWLAAEESLRTERKQS